MQPEYLLEPQKWLRKNAFWTIFFSLISVFLVILSLTLTTQDTTIKEIYLNINTAVILANIAGLFLIKVPEWLSISKISYLIDILLSNHNYEKANELVIESLKVNPYNLYLQNLYARLKIEEDKLDNVIDILNRIIKKKPTFTAALRNYGLYYVKKQLPTQALSFFQKAYYCDKSNPKTIADIISALFQTKQFQKLLIFYNENKNVLKNNIQIFITTSAYAAYSAGEVSDSNNYSTIINEILAFPDFLKDTRIIYNYIEAAVKVDDFPHTKIFLKLLQDSDKKDALLPEQIEFLKNLNENLRFAS